MTFNGLQTISLSGFAGEMFTDLTPVTLPIPNAARPRQAILAACHICGAAVLFDGDEDAEGNGPLVAFELHRQWHARRGEALDA